MKMIFIYNKIILQNFKEPVLLTRQVCNSQLFLETKMKPIPMLLIYLCAATIFFPSDTNAQQTNKCTNITIKFEYKINILPTTIYYKEAIGTIASPPTPANKIKNISVCIDEKVSKTIGKYSISYADNDKIVIFNTWSGGTYLKDNDTIPCFPDWTSALLQTVQKTPQMIYDIAMTYLENTLRSIFENKIINKLKA